MRRTSTAAAQAEARLSRGKGREAPALNAHARAVVGRNDRTYRRPLLRVAAPDPRAASKWQPAWVQVVLSGKVDGIEACTGRVVEVKNRSRGLRTSSSAPRQELVQVMKLEAAASRQEE